MATQNISARRDYRNYYKRISPVFKSKRNQAYLMVVLSLFAMSFFGSMAVRPTLTTIATLRRKIDDHTFISQQLETKINSLVQAQSEYKKIEKDIPLVYNALPDKPEIPVLIAYLERLAKAHNVELTQFTADPVVIYGSDGQEIIPSPPTQPQNQPVLGETTAGNVTAINLHLVYSGNYANIIDLLENLNNLERVMTLDSIQITYSQQNATLSIDSIAQAYYFPELLTL